MKMTREMLAPVMAAMAINSAVCSESAEIQTITTTTTTTTTTFTEGESDNVDYIPKIHGVIISRWEGEFDGDDFAERFQVRNARVSVGGNIMRDLTYFIMIDACQQGKIQFLDAYARWGFLKQWKIQAGQFRVPYGVDVFRAPGTYIFSNRSFLAKHMMNMRQVGFKAGYYCDKIPLTIEAGVFNSAPTSNHAVWQHEMNFAAKALYRISNVTVSGGFISAHPDCVRITGGDGALTWATGRWIVEGEYQVKHYARNQHPDAHAWNMFASYGLPLKKTVFNQLSFQGRYDGMTDHSTGTADAEGKLVTDNPGRHRITVGSTLSFERKAVKALVRLNYEKYFHMNNVSAPAGERDKIVADLVVKF